jgi:hypothetical protein
MAARITPGNLWPGRRKKARSVPVSVLLSIVGKESDKLGV